VRRPSLLAVGRVARYRSNPAIEARRCWRPGLVADRAFERAEIISGRCSHLRRCYSLGTLGGALGGSVRVGPWLPAVFSCTQPFLQPCLNSS
jgi:hypothetical protein